MNKRSLLLAATAVAVFCAPLAAQVSGDLGPDLGRDIVREIVSNIQEAFSKSDHGLIINAYILAAASIHAPYEVDESIGLDAAAALQMPEYMYKMVFVDPNMASDAEREKYADTVAAYVPRMASELERLAYEADRRGDQTTLSRLASLVRETVMMEVLGGGRPARPKGGEAAGVSQMAAFSGFGGGSCEAGCEAERERCNAGCPNGQTDASCRMGCGLGYSLCIGVCDLNCERGNDTDGDGIDDCDEDDDGFGWWPY